LVVVGDLTGSGSAQEQAVVGETPNLAARLQGLAEPNTVVIAEGTRRLLGNLFELEDLGAKDLKGITDPVRAWAALRASSAEGRFEALHTAGLTALVGREEELELVLRRWSRAKTGEGQAVLLSGEAGIGKSRLTAALLEKLTGEPHTRLRYFCSPQHTDSPSASQVKSRLGAMSALCRRRIGGEVIRAQYRRKNLAEIDEFRLQAFDLEANSAAAGEGQRHDAGRRIALDEFDREQIEHGVFVRLIEASTLAGVDALEPQRRPAASVIRRVLGVF
jgi:hypothetical protein